MQRGDSLPHFDVTTVDGRRSSYSTIWQHRNLVLVVLPTAESAVAARYVAELTSRAQEFSNHASECIITRDAVPGLGGPGVIVADRWGEVFYSLSAPDVRDFPSPDELLEWLAYIQIQCPECQGEVR
jgi:hypothetical protein